MTKSEGTAVGIFAIIGVLALVPAAIILNGLALSVLWGWFIVPVFHLPEIRIVQAIGIAMVAAIFSRDTDAAPQGDKKWAPLIRLITAPLSSIFFGWIIRMFL